MKRFRFKRKELGFTDEIIRDYSRKIFGFAYSVTKNIQNAEDLSQDILTELVSSSLESRDISNLDAYIYKICKYTWSKFLRRNSNHLNTIDYPMGMMIVDSSEPVDEKMIRDELIGRMRKEISYLGKVRREILISTYFGNRKSRDVAEDMNILASTVRWHLSETRKELKERINMNNNEIINEPVKPSTSMLAKILPPDCYNEYFKRNMLVQNICVACYKHAKSIEDIARAIGAAAVYVENEIEGLVDIGYLIEEGRGKYRTNFFISDYRIMMENVKFFNSIKTFFYGMRYFYLLI